MFFIQKKQPQVTSHFNLMAPWRNDLLWQCTHICRDFYKHQYFSHFISTHQWISPETRLQRHLSWWSSPATQIEKVTRGSTRRASCRQLCLKQPNSLHRFSPTQHTHTHFHSNWLSSGMVVVSNVCFGLSLVSPPNRKNKLYPDNSRKVSFLHPVAWAARGVCVVGVVGNRGTDKVKDMWRTGSAFQHRE